MKSLLSVLVFLLASSPVVGQELQDRIQAKRIREHTRFLSHDLMEGRGPGSRGGDLAAAYIANQFALTGLAPGNGDSYFQPVPMTGVRVIDPVKLEFKTRAGETISLRYGSEFVGWPAAGAEAVLPHTEMVFAGYGIRAPEVPWDDYQGQDVKGKVLLLLVNDPPSDDPSFFGGKGLTYYGRWTYKFEEAARQGAAGVLLIHNTEMAGYPWQVVETSWSGEQFRLPAHQKNGTLLEGWMQQDKGDQLLRAAGLTFEKAREMAGKAGFRPVPLGISVSVDMKAAVRQVQSPNVVAKIEGADPRLKDEFILVTSHYDHLGIGKEVAGDGIYNGALDNASGTAGLIELARVLYAHRASLSRSVLFAAVTAEEQGLLGSAYYAAQPLVPLSRTVANFNFDAINVWSRTSDMVAMGEEHSTLTDVVRKVADEMKVRIVPDPQPEKGSFFRSDQFSLVKVGVPAVYLRFGMEFEGKPAGWGERLINDYTAQHYHQPTDEFDESWSFEGAEQMMEFVRRMVTLVATSPQAPQWRDGSRFSRHSSD